MEKSNSWEMEEEGNCGIVVVIVAVTVVVF